jgi:hypothetical protein
MGIFDSYNKHFNPFNLVNKLNPANKADKYLKDIPGMGHEMYDPYINAGKGQIPGLENEYKSLMGNTGDVMKRLGEGYQKSPGFDFAMKQALGASGNAAAAGGMAGSPEHEMENMGLATDLANQDFNTYLKNAMGLYERGLSGSENMMGGGRNSADALARMLAENSRDRAGNAASGQDWLNQLIMGMAGAGMKGGMM